LGLSKAVLTLSAIFIIAGVLAISYSPPKTFFDSDKGVSGLVFAAPPGKPLDFFMFLGFKNLCRGKIFPLAEKVYINEKAEQVGTDLDAIRFAIHNVGCRFFKYSAADWIYQSRLLLAGKSREEALATENLAAAFQVLPYFNGEKKRAAPGFMSEPYFFSNSGQMVNWKRKFADGKTREIIPKDAFCLRPNTYGLWRTSQTDKIIAAVAIDPEESLPVAFYIFTELCDWKTGEWKDLETLRWLISCQYSFAYGIYIDPEQIEIQGKGLRTKFVFRGKPPVNMVVIRWKNGSRKAVPVVNRKGELCFFGSGALDQSIFIPFSYLPKMEDEDEILLAGGTVKTNFRQIRQESARVRANLRRIAASRAGMHGENIPADAQISAYVVKTEELAEIARRAGGNGTREKKVANIMKFVNIAIPYTSDHDGDKYAAGYNGPVEVLKSPLVAIMDRGDDCEGHATTAASLIFSLYQGDPIALCKLIYKPNGEGHIIPMVPNIGTLDRDPFPNYAIFNGIPFSFLEATGNGDDRASNFPLHQVAPSRRGYLPSYAMVINGHGANRKIGVWGFSQFRYTLN